MSNSSDPKNLQQVITAAETRDGDGVKIWRIAGTPYQTMLDPFLLIDEIRSDDSKDYVGGFPEHPHRGFETITYMLKGGFRHRDHLGNEGRVGPGGAQWMTAGRGILHSEMPELVDDGLHGFQLWLNLPAKLKMCDPAWRDVATSEMDHLNAPDGTKVTLVAGKLSVQLPETEIKKLSGPIQTNTHAVIADISLPPYQSLILHLHSDDSASVRVICGQVNSMLPGQLGVYRGGAQLHLRADESGSRFLFLGGRPVREPIVQYGPFVMNNREEIETAIRDYQAGRLVL